MQRLGGEINTSFKYLLEYRVNGFKNIYKEEYSWELITKVVKRTTHFSNFLLEEDNKNMVETISKKFRRYSFFIEGKESGP